MTSNKEAAGLRENVDKGRFWPEAATELQGSFYRKHVQLPFMQNF